MPDYNLQTKISSWSRVWKLTASLTFDSGSKVSWAYTSSVSGSAYTNKLASNTHHWKAKLQFAWREGASTFSSTFMTSHGIFHGRLYSCMCCSATWLVDASTWNPEQQINGQIRHTKPQEPRTESLTVKRVKSTNFWSKKNIIRKNPPQ
jgi:hypothetical protein